MTLKHCFPLDVHLFKLNLDSIHFSLMLELAAHLVFQLNLTKTPLICDLSALLLYIFDTAKWRATGKKGEEGDGRCRSL